MASIRAQSHYSCHNCLWVSLKPTGLTLWTLSPHASPMDRIPKLHPHLHNHHQPPSLLVSVLCTKAMVNNRWDSFPKMIQSHVVALESYKFLKWLVLERGVPLADWCRTNLTGASKLETLPANLFVSLPISKRERLVFLVQCLTLLFPHSLVSNVIKNNVFAP